MPLRFRPKLHLTEREVRYAMSHSDNNTQAAKFLGIHLDTYRQYAKQYVDEDTGETLYDLHKRQGNFTSKRNGPPVSTFAGLQGLQDILEGKHPQYSGGKRLFTRMLHEGLIAPVCDQCGFCERRITDNALPLKLDYIDGNTSNHLRENLRVLCYNCWFLSVGNIKGVYSVK